jgi:hypothetical protein
MKRFGVAMRKHRWAVLAALGLLAVAGSAVIYSGAVFNYRTANPTNVFTAGVLKHTNNHNGATLFLSSPLLKPGMTPLTGTVTITNTGDLDGTFQVSGTLVDSNSGADNSKGADYTGYLEDVLNLKITDEANTEVYNGSPADFTQAIGGTWASAQAHTYTFEVTWPDGGIPSPADPDAVTGDNLYKGASLTMDFEWYEQQT